MFGWVDYDWHQIGKSQEQPQNFSTAHILSDSCLDGTYKTLSDFSCVPCPAGYYQNISNQLACMQCPTGYYQHERGKHFCYKCPDMKTTYKFGADTVFACKGNITLICDKIQTKFELNSWKPKSIVFFRALPSWTLYQSSDWAVWKVPERILSGWAWSVLL